MHLHNGGRTLLSEIKASKQYLASKTCMPAELIVYSNYISMEGDITSITHKLLYKYQIRTTFTVICGGIPVLISCKYDSPAVY